MRKIFTQKRYWAIAIITAGIIWWWFAGWAESGLPAGIETGVVTRGEVMEVVSETGYVKAVQSVEAAFTSGGRVTDILVIEGSVVEGGEVMVRLDDAAALANIASAQARLEAEQLRLQELQSGADINSVAVTQSAVVSAETALKNAKQNVTKVTTQQNQLVANAAKNLRTTGLQAYLVNEERENSDGSYMAPQVTGVYDSEEEGVYRMELYRSNAPSGYSYRLSGLETGVEPVSAVNPTAVGTRGLFVQFPDNFAARTEWEIPVPNTRSTSYLNNLNAYQAAVKSRDLAIANAESAVAAAAAALQQVQSQLTQVSGSARTERVAAQRALVRQMQAAVRSAQVQYDNTILTAPFSGLVTDVFTEVGQIVSATAPAVSLISQGQYELVVSISEVDIAEISQGDKAAVRFDAYDNDVFDAHVARIAPKARLVDGVRVLEVTLVFDALHEEIRDGLSADIDITTAKREGVVAVPTRSIYEDAEGKFIRVISGDEIQIVRVETGLRGSDGKTEIISGLNGGETIITFASEEDIAAIEK